MKPVSSLPRGDQAAIRDLVELAVKHRRLFRFDGVPLELAERVQLRLLDHGYAATWDGPDLVTGRMF